MIELSKYESLDDFLEQNLPIDLSRSKVNNTLYGFNTNLNEGANIYSVSESRGYVFFTRPQLNLSTPNIINVPKFRSLSNESEDSVHRFVRCTLDPYLYKNKIKSSLVDDENPFISIMTNSISSMSAWPDPVLSSHVSKKTNRGAEWSIGDGILEINESFDIDCVFTNTVMEPILHLADTWLTYISSVLEDTARPYIGMVSDNEIDYNTRIYRIILDVTGRRVSKIAAVGAAYPVSCPMGEYFSYNAENYLSDKSKEVSVRFKCTVAMYNEDILIDEFNRHSMIFNPSVRNMLTGKPHSLVKITDSDMLVSLSNRVYPLINRRTLELEWWIEKSNPRYIKRKSLTGGKNDQ